MSATLDTAAIKPAVPPQAVTPPTIATAHWGCSAQQVLVIAGFCLLFLYHNYLPLFHSDLWGHVAYGDWIIQQRQLPQEDPFAELSAGVPVLASAWLSQVLLALVGGGADPEPLAHLFAGTLLITSLVWLRIYYLQSSRLVLSAMGVLVALGIAWSRHAVQRPETFGLLCLALVVWCLIRVLQTSPRQTSYSPVIMLLLFAAWANLHGSFIVGLIVLGCAVAGRAIDIALWAGRLAAPLRDVTFHRLVWCLELALVGCCCNPYGIDLLLNTLLFPSHPNLDSVLEWFPLEMKSLEGIPMALSWGLTMVLLRHSRQRVSAIEVLWLLVFSAAVCSRVRMIAWYAPLWVTAMLPHAADVLTQLDASAFGQKLRNGFSWTQQRSLRWTLCAGLMIWLTFAWSPISRPLLGGSARRADQVLSHQTPLGVTDYLNQHPPTGLIFAPQWWGDWLGWRGPVGVRVMATTNAIHLLPSQVWQDYLAISELQSGWEQRLDRYRINTVVASQELQPDLCRALLRSPEWNVVFEDDIGLVATRKVQPLLTPDETAQPAAPTAVKGPVPGVNDAT